MLSYITTSCDHGAPSCDAVRATIPHTIWAASLLVCPCSHAKSQNASSGTIPSKALVTALAFYHALPSGIMQGIPVLLLSREEADALPILSPPLGKFDARDPALRVGLVAAVHLLQLLLLPWLVWLLLGLLALLTLALLLLSPLLRLLGFLGLGLVSP